MPENVKRPAASASPPSGAPAPCPRARSRERAPLRPRKLRVDARDNELGKGRGLGVTCRRVAGIIEHARQIEKILRLAVPIEQARENPQHLDVPLQSGQIEPAQKLGGGGVLFESHRDKSFAKVP